MSHGHSLTHIAQSNLSVHTRPREMVDITEKIADAVLRSGIRNGVAQVFVQHTSCSLIIGENADPAVRRDLERFFARLVPDGDSMFEHADEGPDDMPAHVRAALTGSSLSVPVHNARLALGTWQAAYLWEHRDQAYQRKLVVTVMGH